MCYLRLPLSRASLNFLIWLHVCALIYMQTSLIFPHLWIAMMSWASCWSVFLGCVALNVCIILPRRFRKSPRMMQNLWFVVTTCLGMLYLLPSHSSSQHIMETSVILLTFRLPAVVMCTYFPLLVISNLLFLVAVWAKNDGNVAESQVKLSLLAEGSIFLFTLVLSLALQTILAQCAAWKLQRDDSKTQLGTASALLRFMCDALVTTDDSFRLEHPSPNLAAMLYEDDTLEGKCLTDLMPEFEAGEQSRTLLTTTNKCNAKCKCTR